jgi:hypothetical protein
MVYIALDDKVKAIEWTDRCVDERRGWAAYLRVHPAVDPLRGEPEFARILERMKYDAPAGPAVSET